MYIKIFLILLTVTVCNIALQAQGTGLSPAKDKAVLIFKLYNPVDNSPWKKVELTVSSKKMANKLYLTTNEAGEAEALLPINDIYTLHLNTLPDFGSIEVGDGAFQKHYIPIPYDGKGVKQVHDNQAAKKMVMLRLSINDKKGHPVKRIETITLQDKKHNKTYQLKTNEQGLAAMSLPRDGVFVVSLNGAPNYYQFEVPDAKCDIWEERIAFERKTGFSLFPTIGKGLLNFRYVDLQNQAVANETFTITAEKTGEKYQCVTNKYGIAQVLLPLNQTYLFSHSYNPNFERMAVKLSEGFDVFEFEVLYQSPSSAEWAERIAELDAMAALRDSMNLLAEQLKPPTPKPHGTNALVDEMEEYQDFDRPIPIKNLKTFKVKKAIEKKAERLRDSLTVNPNIFDDYNKPILSTLNRFKGDWNKKVIVTDVTASMSSYMEEVLLWHALNLVKGTHSKYIFFNDGDDKITSNKHIGKTGGTYFCEGKLEHLDAIIEKMQEAARFRMGGGEPPENDVEALLAGISKRDSIDEIILIADAYSRVRDMELLVKVNLPVRIILCGVEENNQFYRQKQPINEQYLTMALRTGGSIHTLSNDIIDLSKKSDGDVIELQGIRYLLKNHQFIKLR